jgi:hypothetical protein
MLKNKIISKDSLLFFTIIFFIEIFLGENYFKFLMNNTISVEATKVLLP